MVSKIVSGGQTGVDRAALDVAINLEIPQGGWCPKGRRAELETTIPNKYQLKETESSEFDERTKLNVRDSDGTLVIVPKLPLSVQDGTFLTIEELKRQNKPYLVFDLSNPVDSRSVLDWINKENISTLNVAGPRESKAPGIYQQAFDVLEGILKNL